MEEIYSSAMVAEMLRISEDAVKQLMADGLIRAQCTKRQWTTTHSCVVEYLHSGTTHPDSFEMEE